jgi:ribosomal protein S18 acetylase RimI-like enzyme
MIEYRDSLEGIGPSQLEGFFARWRKPLTCEEHHKALQNSSHILLAYDTQIKKVIGFVNVLSDGVNFAFIPMLEVLPEYQGRGIGSQLMERILESLKDINCIDLICDEAKVSFYERFGMLRSCGMVIRKYLEE